jgi:hypothetical protein
MAISYSVIAQITASLPSYLRCLRYLRCLSPALVALVALVTLPASPALLARPISPALSALFIYNYQTAVLNCTNSLKRVV